MVERMRSVCPTERLAQLDRLIKRYGFYVVDELPPDERGRALQGLYDVHEGDIYLSRELLGCGAYNVLGVYLHELTHAGAWSGGRPMLVHDRKFARYAGFAYEAFGIHLGPVMRIYDMHEAVEAEQQAAVKVESLPWLFMLIALAGGLVLRMVSIEGAALGGALVLAVWVVWRILDAV